MKLRLYDVLQQRGVSHAALAKAVGVSRTAITQIATNNVWPARDPAGLRTRIAEHLSEPERSLFSRMAPAREGAPAPTPRSTEPDTRSTDMVLRFQRLTDATRRHFGIHRDPFAAPQSHDDVFLSPDIRYAREALMDKCRHGGFLALIGESGSGKSTLREELNDRLQREKQPVIVIEPYIVAMEDNDTRGKALKAQHIGESIMRAIAPLATTKSSPEARWAQMHEALKDSARAGNRHVLIIEEAHSLPVPTIRHLKRFLELKDGMRQLIAVVLIGQQELERKLSDTDPTVREIVQRIEIVHLHPLDNELEPFLRHRFERVGLDLKKIVAPGAIDAMRVALSPSGKGSLLYPLAVQNMVSRALNAAAGIGAPLVDAAVVRSV